MRLRGLLCGYVAILAALPVACGDDGSNPATGAAGHDGDAGGPDGEAGSASSTGGSRGSGDAGSGSGEQAGAGGESPGAGGGGPSSSCIPRDAIPNPVTTKLTVQSNCPASAACASELEGTSWAYSEVCLDAEAIFQPLFEECASSQLNGPADVSIVGSIAFAGGTMTHSATITGTGVFQVPNQCHYCNCAEYDDVLKQNGAGPNTYCYPDCYPDLSCRCLVDFEVEVSEQEPYEVEDGALTLDSGKSYAVCAGDGGLSLAEQGTQALPGTVKLISSGATRTPEICDGIDNDKNGAIDDEPVDCPPVPCNHKGVCAGVEPVCVGSWVCDYSGVEHYEATSETTCDGLDNDCDGEVDEGLVDCYEKCDGLDNDNNGVVDDDPQDSPCLAKLGVCASGTTSTCLGEAGWRCDFDDADYEADETTCGDGLDNDCDGQIDEGCSCPLGKSQLFIVQWGQDPELLRADLDGGNVQSVTALSDFVLTQVAVDRKNNHLYFGDGADKLWRSNLDGSGMTQLWTGKAQTWAVNPATGLLLGECNTSNICRLNSPNTTTTLVSPASATWVNIDPVNQRVWWADHGGSYEWNFIYANFDGSGVGGIGKAQLSSPLNFALDPAGSKIYWQKGQAIYEVGMDGSNEKQLIPLTSSYVYDMVVDHNGGMLYYTEVNGSQVRRVGLDGTGDEQIIPNVPYGVSLDLYICP